MKKHLLIVLAFASLTLIMTNIKCGGSSSSSGSSADITAPTVESKGPATDAANIALDVVITATFSEAMNPDTITNTSFMVFDVKNISYVTGLVTYDADSKTATFTPSANLALGSHYQPMILSGAKDLAGNAMSYFTWSFYTRDGAWDTAELIELDETGHAFDPQVDTDPFGNAIAVWQQSNGTTTSIYANVYISGTGWSGTV